MTMHVDHTKALGAVRYFRSLRIADGNPGAASAWVAGQNFRNADALLELHTRAGVSAADAADLRGRNPVLTDLAGEVRRLSILGNLPGVVRLPFMSSTIAMGGAVRAYWIAQGKAVPASPITFGDPQLLDDRTVGALLIARDRFLREAGAQAERALAEELIRATAEAFDTALIDVANDGTGDAPASITYGGYKTECSGVDLEAIDNDLSGLVQVLADEDLRAAAWVMHPRSAVYISALRSTSGGCPTFPALGVNGGTLYGIPVITSTGVPISEDSPATTQISLLIGSGIAVAGGEVELHTSKQGTIEMADDPTGDAATPTAQSKQAVSLFQNNCTALMTIGHINWRARRSTVAATLTGVTY